MTLVSIAAGGVAKSLVAVTISLHPGAAQQARHDITVQRGDSLSAISLHEYGTAAQWPALWWANRRQVPDPSMIVPGERLIVPSGPRASRWLVRAAQAATAAPRHAAVAAVARPAFRRLRQRRRRSVRHGGLHWRAPHDAVRRGTGQLPELRDPAGEQREPQGGQSVQRRWGPVRLPAVHLARPRFSWLARECVRG